MISMSPTRIEQLSSTILSANVKQRPKMNLALEYAMQLEENPNDRCIYTESLFNVSLLNKARAIVKFLPNTALALINGKSPIIFDDAYKMTVTMRPIKH